MAVLSEPGSQINLPWLNLEASRSSGYKPIHLLNPNLVQHSPHPSHIRHIRAFEGPPICVVDTDDKSSSKIPSVLFPPNQYVDNKLKIAERNLHLPYHRDKSNMVSARPTLDTILAMKFFTGLRNMSFRDQQGSNIVSVPNPSGWEVQLHQLTSEALTPVMETFENLQKQYKRQSLQRPSTSNSMKRMYSSSGRLLTAQSVSRPSTCCHRRSSTAQGSGQVSEPFQIPPELDTQVFYLLGGILQNPDPEVVKTWLLTATERERSLMISILRSALMDKDELNMFVAEASKEKQSRIIYTPAKRFNSPLPAIMENGPSTTRDILIVHDEASKTESKPVSRPPTSSTFRSSKAPVTRPNSREEGAWIPSESFVIK